MKLWILKAKEDLPSDDNPWDPWYDKCFAMVIRAKSEIRARGLAHDYAHAEKAGQFLNQTIAHTTSPWTDSKYSTCDILYSSKGEETLIIQDVANA